MVNVVAGHRATVGAAAEQRVVGSIKISAAEARQYWDRIDRQIALTADYPSLCPNDMAFAMSLVDTWRSDHLGRVLGAARSYAGHKEAWMARTENLPKLKAFQREHLAGRMQRRARNQV
jgi:hypothetical protein